MSEPDSIWQVTLPNGRTLVPGLVSPSVLTRIESCPRRFHLSRGSYPSIWDRPGYPSRPSVAALAGMVMHRSTEIIGAEVYRSAGTGEARFVAAMRSLGGFDALVERVTDELTINVTENPRAQYSRDWLVEQLRRKHQDIREQVQGNSSILDVGQQRRNEAPLSTQPRRLGPGTYFEIELLSPNIGCKGRLDCLSLNESGVEIIDFKSGERSSEHEFQLRFYQMVWANDRVHNPDGLATVKLALIYPKGTHYLEPLDTEQLSEFTSAIVERIIHCREQLESDVPQANPTRANCEFCDVRHLCDEYWKQPGEEMFIRPSVRRVNTLIDVRLELKEAITDSVWLVQSQGGGLSHGTSAHLRCGVFREVFEQMKAGVGTKLRLIAASHMTQDDGTSALSVISVDPTSEVFFES